MAMIQLGERVAQVLGADAAIVPIYGPRPYEWKIIWKNGDITLQYMNGSLLSNFGSWREAVSHLSSDALKGTFVVFHPPRSPNEFTFPKQKVHQ